jgi:hypothetical protein
MIRKLHPTLKKCKCGLICSRNQLYKHFDSEAAKHAGDAVRQLAGQPVSFFCKHGEVPLNTDDPLLTLTPREEARSRFE